MKINDLLEKLIDVAYEWGNYTGDMNAVVNEETIEKYRNEVEFLKNKILNIIKKEGKDV